MTLTISGNIHEDLFGLPWLKKTIPVHQVIDAGTIAKGETIKVLSGQLTVGIIPVEAADGSLDVELKVATLGFVILDKTEKLVSGGVQTIKVGSGQLEFDGTYEITA